jgi:hypothetical protein
LTGDRVGAHPEQVEEVFLADGRALLDPAGIVQGNEPATEKDPRWGARLGVVAGQTGGLLTPSITGGDGFHQVPIARAQSHLA